jgi:hypothetical protein
MHCNGRHFADRFPHVLPETQMKSFTSRLIGALAIAALGSAMFVPLQASAEGTSQGHGIKCYYVLVSSDPATGTYVYQTVCGKGV